LHEKLFTELIAGTGNFDMVCMAGQWMGEIVPYLEDIEPYIEGPDVISDFQKSSYDVYNFSGVQYGFPYQTDAYSIFYRTDIFKENGIEPNPNWTWEEYIDISRKLTRGGMYGASLAGVKHQQNVYFINRYWGLGGKTTSPDWKVTIDNPTTIKALELLKETYKYTSPKAAGGDISELNNVFLSGSEVAMLEGWPSLIFGLLDNPDASNVIGKWSVLPTPGDGPIYGSLWGIGISKDSKNKQAAYEWIKFYTSRENQKYFWEKYGMIPVRKSIWEDPDVLKVRPYAANYALGLARARPNWRITAANEGWEGILNDEVSKYITGEQSAEKTAQNIQKKWTELLERKPAPAGYKNTE
jgi:ABC-type glycerol-3-phosphate transport system substrate-binding protein